MLPESTSFSDDTTMKSAGRKGSFEDLSFLMEILDARLGEIYTRLYLLFSEEKKTNIVLGYVLNENKGDGTVALALLKILSVSRVGSH